MSGGKTVPVRRRAFVAVFALAVVSSLTVPAPLLADEAGSVVFKGSGWGHGIGLSQYGAYGMSKYEDATYEEILEHFFTGASVGVMGQGGLRAKDDPSNLWVNLEQDFESITLAALRTNRSVPGTDVTITRGNDTWIVEEGDQVRFDGSATCTLTLLPATGSPSTSAVGECDFDLTWDGDEEHPTTKLRIDEVRYTGDTKVSTCEQADWNLDKTVYVPCQYGRGQMHLRSGPGGHDLSVELDIDDYVRGIAEMPYGWGLAHRGGMEALKAQAIAARSYARELQLWRGEPGNNSCAAWCHVRDTTWDQRYVGWGHGAGSTQYVDYWLAAVEATDGMVLTHPDAPNDTVVRTYYSSSSGGATENIWEVRTGWDHRQYYSSVPDPWALDPAVNPNASWRTSRDADDVAAVFGWDELTGAEVTERNTSGSVATVVFTGIDAGAAVTTAKSGGWARSTFGLKSTYFDIDYHAAVIGGFTDITGSVHAVNIAWLAEQGITKGCNPPANDRFCPTGAVTRGQMAAFIVRAQGLPATAEDYFTDDESSVFEDDINRLAAAGLTNGCGGGRYCPTRKLTRGEMAALLTRTLGLTDDGGGDLFVDDDDSIFETDIDRLRVAGVTLGCNPPANDRFCPEDVVTRAQMASFFARAFG